MQVSKSNKLANVCYDIRGPVLKHAKRLEEEGHRILKLNIGNPAPSHLKRRERAQARSKVTEMPLVVTKGHLKL